MPNTTFPGIQGRVAVVTGGSRGIGAACATLLAEQGARVAITYRSDQDGAFQVVDAIHQTGGDAMAIRADAADEQATQAMVDSVRESFASPIELLVNNAGIFEVVAHDATDLEQWRRTIDINLTGVFNTIWAVKQEMVQQQFGRIVNVASIAGLRARPTCIAYSVSKAGVIHLTKSLAEAVAEHNVRVNAVAPGLIDTEMIADVDPASKQALIDATPIQRLGSAEEIANTILFLLSDLSSFTTGQTVVASGGRVLLP